MKKNIFKSGGFQSLLASLLCIVLGLFLGYLVLLLINPAGAGEAILTVIKNFMTYNRPASQLKYFGNTLVKTAPLLMCALAILFAYVFLPIGVLALIGGIILLVTSQKNGQGAPVAAGAAAGMGSGKAPARGGRGPVEKRAVLRGVTGKYSGQSFDLLKGKVVIGRDPATCNIVFDKNTPGISGRHCQVVYDPNEDCFIITDLGSSYGTFLGNGKKLTANVAEKLSTGDTFYLCDNANRFVVSKE